MQDNIIYKLELTDEQYMFLEQVKNEYIEKINTKFEVLGKIY